MIPFVSVAKRHAQPGLPQHYSGNDPRSCVMNAAMDQCGEFILVANRHGIIEYVNPAFTHITGYAAEEVLGKSPSILSSRLYDQSFYQTMWSCILDGQVWRGEVIDRRKNGELYHAQMSISPVSCEMGEITHFICMQRDVSELRRVEQELLHVRKMESIGQLASGLAHDLNNMLTGVLGRIELAASDNDDASSRHHLREAERQGLRATELISELMTFARKDRPFLKPVNLAQLVEQAVHAYVLPNRSESVHLESSAAASVVMADELLVHRSLGNLIRNAFDAMEHLRAPQLHIRVRETESSREPALPSRMLEISKWVCVDVADNGHGIDPEKIERIFEPFFTTKEAGKGSGLGLASVYGVMRSHAGHVVVQSTPGYGTTFSLFFPYRPRVI